MQNQFPVWVGLIPAIFALLGALGSQIITARANLKSKRLELSYARKAEAYKDLVIKAGTFAHTPGPEGNYVEFLHAYLATLIVASKHVKEVLREENGVHDVAQQLRVAQDYFKKEKLQTGAWFQAMERLIDAMHKDLYSLAGH